MSDERSERAKFALSRWEDEGGAGTAPPPATREADETQPDVAAQTDSEIRQLRVRMIALENVVIAMIATSSEAQLDLIREMAAFISPRCGFTPHPMTIRAAVHMNDLVDRAEHFR
ncbi:conserved hypothetical protein (plasmid) [Phenylobacterium zucineum HLK1]|uniref:Uncharacterized protein n=1 Tax=Phenylobacterium zucineum (strain HLK1) TaxID=450851 RepID=B4RI96_PHEZH|nr:hypothetical protein [Phenylobacterium zucineum]ACG80071.1 conserved hypothetical protein [Phenylobacterium zucineum HLK1]